MTIFKMPDAFNLRFTISAIFVLVIVTISFEKGCEHLEHAVHHAKKGAHIKHELLQKMYQELTILGFVAFSATILLQAELLTLDHEQHVNYEFSHILMFLTAVVYAKEIFLVSVFLARVIQTFELYDELPPKDLLDEQVRRFGQRTSKGASGPELNRPVSFLARTYELHRDRLTGAFSFHCHACMFKALKLQFLGFNGMLNSRFPVSKFVEKVTELHVGELVELGPLVWGCLGVVLGLAYAATYEPFISAPLTGTALFVVWGFALLLGEILLLFAARDQLDFMLEMNHHVRTEDDSHQEYLSHQAIIEAEMTVMCKSKESRAEAEKINCEMAVAHEAYRGEFQILSKQSKRRLSRLETAFQFLMLCQSMLQSLILLMLGRNSFVFFGALGGLAFLAMLCLPTALMTLFVTPRVLECLSLAFALGIKTKLHDGVLEEMLNKLEHEGDYSQASQVLQLAMTEKLDDADLKNEAKVREKIKDLIKLGEMKWRYRVVEEEQSPRDEAIKVLDEAIRYIDSHVTFMLQAEGAKDITTHAKWAYKERHWAPELSECSQGLALARLIFNRDRGEDETIDNLLREALQLREILKDKAKLADTENSLGSLAQKQANFTEAERHYKLALELRREILPASEAQHKEKDQFLAQSYTSLGNLYHDWGAARCAEKDGSHDLHMSMALEHLAQAKTHYVKGFNPRHPKVAWAVEAQANVHKKMRNYTLAIACVNEAIALRKGLQNKSDGKALFSKEIEKDADALSELEKGQRSAGAFKKVVKGGIRAERKALFAEGKLKSTLYDSVGDFASIASTIPPALPDNHPGERARRVSHEKVLHTPPSSKPPSVAHIKAANRRKSLAPHMC